VVEVVIGVGLLLEIDLRFALLAFLTRMLGTFLALVTQPAEAFHKATRFFVTAVDEFVIKDFLLIPRAWLSAAG
jgi:hypothetical protein